MLLLLERQQLAGFELLSLKQQQHRKPGSWHWHIIAERRP